MLAFVSEPRFLPLSISHMTLARFEPEVLCSCVGKQPSASFMAGQA
jgi:hypothetical protein